MNTERAATGISGLDSLLEGGFPVQRSYMISGSAGSGKTILCSQILYNGVYKFSEKGLYVSFEEPVDDILDDLKRFDWKMEPYLADDSLKYLHLPMLKTEYEDNVFQLLTVIMKEVKDNGYKRLVLDSLPALGLVYKDYNLMRKELYLMLHEIRKTGCTTFIITEKASTDIGHTRFGVEDFLAHGLVLLHASHTYRGIEIRKMRGTAHSTDVNRMRIGESGISVYPGDHPY